MVPVDNSAFVFTAALVRSIMYVVLGGVGVYIAAVGGGDSQQHAIYKGLAAAVTAATLRLGVEGGYDASRAKTGDVQTGDVGAGLPAKIVP